MAIILPNITYDNYVGGGVTASQLLNVSASMQASFGTQGDSYIYNSEILDFIFEEGITSSRKIFWKLSKNTAGTAYDFLDFIIYDKPEVNYIRWTRDRTTSSTGRTEPTQYYAQKGTEILYNGNHMILSRAENSNFVVTGGLPIIDEDDVDAFINGNEAVAINYVGPRDDDHVYYYFYNTLVKGTANQYGDFIVDNNVPVVKHWERFYVSNGKRMALTYKNPKDQEIVLKMEDGIAFEKTEWFDERSGEWSEYPGSVHYSGPWYDGFNGTTIGKIFVSTSAKGHPYSNIPFYNNDDDADKYIDHDPGAPAPDWDGNITNPNPGGEMDETPFGTPNHYPLMTTQFACTTSAMRDFASWIYTDDNTAWDNIKKGLELFGDSPSEAIVSVMYFPDNVLDYVTAFATDRFKVGGTTTPTFDSEFQQIVITGKPKLIGKRAIHRTFNDWRDFEPYTKAYIYLPYCGIHHIDLCEYYGKILEIWYVIDTWSGGCSAILKVDGKYMDSFEGQMGVSQSFRATDFGAYAQAEIGAIASFSTGVMSAGASLVSLPGAIGGLTLAGAMGIGTQLTGMSGALASSGIKVLSNSINDYQKTIGASNGNIMETLPQEPFLILETIDTYEPENNAVLNGKPSGHGGTIESFGSGFLACSSVNLKCPSATESERSALKSMLANGIRI